MRAFCLSQQGVPSWNHLSLQLSSLSVYLYCKIQRGLLCPFRNPHLMFIYVIWSFSSFLCTSSLVFHLIIISVFAFITSSAILSFRIPSPSFQSSLSCALIIAISHSQIPVVLLDSTQDTIVHPKFIDCSQNVTTSTDEFLFHCCSKHCSPSDTLSYGWPICQWTIYAKLL